MAAAVADKLAPDMLTHEPDPDEVQETRQLDDSQGNGPALARCPFSHNGSGSVKLNVIDRTHYKSDATAALLEEVGGVAKIREAIELFYSRMFADPHLDQFVRDHDDPHAERLADWIAEKMGGSDEWTQKRRTRPRKEVILAGGFRHVVHDRSSAHAAAWYSPKRPPELVGEHFKLNDARIWLRLMFWSARDVGLLDNQKFGDWYQRFLGHFVRIYESKAVQFVRESARWSESAANISAYTESGNQMPDVHVSYAQALTVLPNDEKPESSDWPYEQD